MGNLNDRVNIGVGVIVTRDIDGIDCYLLSERIGEKHGKGEWSFPGGKPEGGEDPAYAAARELYEETGLPPYGLWNKQFWTYDRYQDDEVHFVTLYFQVDADDREPRNTEPHKHGPWQWLSKGEIRTLRDEGKLFSGCAAAIDLD